MKVSNFHLYNKLSPPPDGVKLHLGSGYKRIKGMINIDVNPDCQPNLCVDLEKDKWPFDTCSVDYACCVSTLEHIRNVLYFMGEAWRVLKVGARFEVIVPYWLNAAAIEDPTHVREFGIRSMGYYASNVYQINTSWYSADRFNFRQVNFDLLGDKISKVVDEALIALNNEPPRTPADEVLKYLLRTGNMPGVFRYVHYQLEKMELPDDDPRTVVDIEF